MAMYCKKCGTKIDDDSIFCSKCGICLSNEISLTTNNEPKEEVPLVTQTEKERNSDGCLAILLITIFAILAIVIAVALANYYASNNKDESTPPKEGILQIIKRDATNKDIEISDSIDLSSLSIALTIHPNCDIDDLEITLNYYDKNGVFLKSQTEKIGDVEKGKKETINISITDFSLTEILKIYKTQIGVTGGSVSIFQ